jgi:flagellar L-ring protein precursor FlgH
MGLRRKSRAGYLILSLCLLSACAGGKAHIQPQASMVEPTGAKTATAKDFSGPSEADLLRQGEYSSLFQDLRAHQVGDLVTINIVETSKASKAADTKTARDSSIAAGIDNALGYESKLKNVFPRSFDNTSMFKASMTNQFTGSGSTSRDESMTAAITARVLEVLPNGNLHIAGTRQIRVNNEIQYITLSGVIRPVDISPDNTILSSYIADAKIDYTGKGPVSDKQRPGWLARILDSVWPF